jgi:hypothetical protein
MTKIRGGSHICYVMTYFAARKSPEDAFRFTMQPVLEPNGRMFERSMSFSMLKILTGYH